MPEGPKRAHSQFPGRWRLAAWGGAALLLLLPWLAMRFTDEVNWSPGDFLFAGILLFGSLAAYEVAVRRASVAAYRTGMGLAIAATFLLVWSNAAVSITDSAADALYDGAAAIAIAGIVVALGRPGAAVPAVLAAALAVAAAGVIALSGGLVPNAYASTFGVLGITAFFSALYAGAAWLLRGATRGVGSRGTV